MGSEPLVCAIMLTRDRPAMAARAVAAFRAQTYARKRLVMWDSGPIPFAFSMDLPDNESCIEDVPDFAIGNLRNRAAEWSCNSSEPTPDIFIHFDDDDLSHPNRIAEQVALLQSSDTECVGYNEVLFWRKFTADGGGLLGDWERGKDGEAWLYSNPDPSYAAGASLCYWRSAWERQPFSDLQVGEDRDFIRRVKTVGVSGIPDAEPGWQKAPRLIQSLHGGNTWDGNIEAAIAKGSREWRRVPEWDAYARERCSL